MITAQAWSTDSDIKEFIVVNTNLVVTNYYNISSFKDEMLAAKF